METSTTLVCGGEMVCEHGDDPCWLRGRCGWYHTVVEVVRYHTTTICRYGVYHSTIPLTGHTNTTVSYVAFPSICAANKREFEKMTLQVVVNGSKDSCRISQRTNSCLLT